MKNKTTKLILAIIFALIVSFALVTTVKAEATFDGTAVTIPYEDDVTSLDLGDSGLNCLDVTGIVHNMDTYEITSNDGTQILTGWTNTIWNNNLRSYYSTINVENAGKEIGQQTMTISFTPGNGSTDPSTKTTTLTINRIGSDNLKTVIESLGGEMPTAYTLNTDDVYTSLDDLTGDQYEAILDAAEAYDALGDDEKALVDDIITEKLNMTMADVQQAANDGIERLANDFVDSTKLNDESITDLKEQREVLVNVLTLGDEFDNLSPRTKTRVLGKLNVDSWDEVEERSQNLIDAIDAKLFIQEYIDNSNGKLDDDKVIAGEDAWNNLNDAVKELANQELIETEGIEKTYPELLIRAKANKFLKDNLTTEDGKVIVEANNSNYKQILDAKDNYDALSDEVKDEVNKILTELGNTTYPELLKYAQEIEPAPKTGDIVMIAIVALAISSLGFAVTFIKRKK